MVSRQYREVVVLHSEDAVDGGGVRTGGEGGELVPSAGAMRGDVSRACR